MAVNLEIVKDPLLNVKQAATFLSTTPDQIYQWVHKSVIPYIKLGRAVRFSQTQLDEYIKKNTYIGKNKYVG